jgi:hypothetical protein
MTARLVGSVAGHEDSEASETEVKEIMAIALEWRGGCELAVPLPQNAISFPDRKFLLRWKRGADRKTRRGFPWQVLELERAVLFSSLQTASKLSGQK